MLRLMMNINWKDLKAYIAIGLVAAMMLGAATFVFLDEKRQYDKLLTFIQETKRDCDLEYKGVDGNNINYVYTCPDGSKREYSERL